jgi:hypothetical protein
MQVLFKRNEYDNACENCKYLYKKFDDKEKYPKTILIICKLRRNDFYSKCPLLKKLNFHFWRNEK